MDGLRPGDVTLRCVRPDGRDNVDYEAGTADVLVDGLPYCLGLPFEFPMESVTRLQLGADWSNLNFVYFDDVVVTQ